jgi:hypothetical protein
MDESERSKIEERYYNLGIIKGITNVSDILNSKAISEFNNRNDKEAFVLRKLSDELMEKAKTLRKAYDAKYEVIKA